MWDPNHNLWSIENPKHVSVHTLISILFTKRHSIEEELLNSFFSQQSLRNFNWNSCHSITSILYDQVVLDYKTFNGISARKTIIIIWISSLEISTITFRQTIPIIIWSPLSANLFSSLCFSFPIILLITAVSIPPFIVPFVYLVVWWWNSHSHLVISGQKFTCLCCLASIKSVIRVMNRSRDNKQHRQLSAIVLCTSQQSITFMTPKSTEYSKYTVVFDCWWVMNDFFPENLVYFRAFVCTIYCRKWFYDCLWSTLQLKCLDLTVTSMTPMTTTMTV